jgi:UDPglucose 6-dehydrogenase
MVEEGRAMNIAVVGAGYVGLTIAAGFAKMGHRLTCAEKDPARVAMLRQGRIPFYEPGLSDLVAAALRDGTLIVTGELSPVAAKAEIVFVAVGTPSRPDGEPDLAALDQVVTDLARLPRLGVVALKSTIPVGTTQIVARRLAVGIGCRGVAHTPEFLSEGTAVDDFFRPHRVIIGTHAPRAAKLLSALFRPLHCPILVTDPTTSEMIKYGANAFLAARISFINELAELCERTGADVAAVATGMGLDPRIGPHFLKPGIGFGGSCLPKDTRALQALGRRHAVRTPMLDAVRDVNEAARAAFLNKLEAALGSLDGRTLAAFGLAFKGGTDDLRDSAALDIATRLAARGAGVRVFDPAIPAAALPAVPGMVGCDDPYEAARDADAILLLTDCVEFTRLDWGRLRTRAHRPLVFDGRGLPVRREATAAGFTYVGPGQGGPRRPLPTTDGSPASVAVQETT